MLTTAFRSCAGAAGDAGGPQLDVKASTGQLVIPEEPKVAHGDENLSLADFLASAAARVGGQ